MDGQEGFIRGWRKTCFDSNTLIFVADFDVVDVPKNRSIREVPKRREPGL